MSYEIKATVVGVVNCYPLVEIRADIRRGVIAIGIPSMPAASSRAAERHAEVTRGVVRRARSIHRKLYGKRAP